MFVIKDDDDLVVLDAEEVLQQTFFSSRRSPNIPKSTFQDGSGLFVKGLTLPPLSPTVLN